MKHNQHISFLLFLLLIGNAIRVSAYNITNTTVYYDNTETQWSNVYLRIGKSSYNDAYEVTNKIPGTDCLYSYIVTSWGGLEAFSFANNRGQPNGYSIYQPWNGQNAGDDAITGQTNYIKPSDTWNNATYTYVTNGKNNVDNGCQYYHVTQNDGLLKQAVNISAPNNGSISVQYTDENGNSQTKTSGSFSVAQTCIIMVTATPAEGYTLESITVDGKSFNSGGTHIVRASTTIAATFKKNATTYTVTFDANGHGTAPAAQKINSGEKASEPTAPTATGYTFGGWYTEEACTNAYNFSSAVTQDITLYAQWLKDYSTDAYYYFDEKITGWKGSVGVRMTNSDEYAFILRPAYNGTDNKFKVFPNNPKGADETKIANGENIATGSTLKGDIELSAEGGEWNNILMPATTSDYFVILYYPNTVPNPSDEFLVAAQYSLPSMETFNVSFGVVGETGGTLTATSGKQDISSGDLVSYANFTATPALGYAVEGWYRDMEGTQKIDAAGTETTYSQVITQSSNTVYVKFKKTYAIYFKPNDPNWSNIYAYLFTESPWENGKGVHPTRNRSEYGQMNKLNDSIYYYNLAKTADIKHFAFNDNIEQADYGEFHGGNAVYRSDFHKDMPVFIAEKGQEAEKVNETKYFNRGVWMKFNDTDPGYNLCLQHQGNWDETYRFTAAEAGDYISTVNIMLTAGETYEFWVKNDKPYYFKTKAATCTSENHQFAFYVYDTGGSPITIKPDITGTYTFQLNLANGKVEIDVLYPSKAYRLVYVEKDGSTTVLYHPSHRIFGSEVAQRDTISMYVKPFVRKSTGNNPNTCEIWLQELANSDGKMVWVNREVIDIKDQSSLFPANGVYNFVLVQDGSGASLPIEKVHPYSGEYYIRVGLDRDYQSAENQFRFSDYASQHDERFDHYFCQWREQGKDVRFCVACDYSSCVSDTLVQEPDDDPHHNYTNANGIMQHSANVRFMWNSENNHIDRAYLAGAGSNVILLSRSGISTTQDGGPETNVVLADAQNWVYQHDVYAAVGTRVKLRVKPHNDAQESDYLYLKGEKGQGENEFSDENTVELIGGSQGQTLKVRVIYDFKSNHLICAWLPEQSNTIQGELSLNSDLILIRKEHNEAQQITFQDANAKITKVSQAYGVLSLSKSHFESGEVSKNAKQFYWISFPFDVHLSEVFSALTYGKDYMLKYYNGVERAEKGCWKDSPSFWKMYRSTEGVTLEKGTGYLLHVNISNTASFFAQGNQEVNIYFPSANTDSMTISGEIDSIPVPQHKCSIQRDHRYIYDSNWNLIGVPSWANVDEMGLPNATEINGISVKFLYEYVPNTNGYNPVERKNYNFGSMKAYMVQFAGTIHWKEKSITPSQKPLRAPAATNEQTIRLDLLRGEERLDHTFVQLSDNEGITEDFDLNSDLTKVHNQGCNLYTLIGSEQIEAAANILPMSERTIYVPVGVSVDSDGTYTLALPEEMEGMDVRIADAETGYTHNLLFSPYEVSLTAGTHTQRFSLEIHASSQVTTGCSETDAAGERLRKVLLNGQLLLQTGERLYDAQGKRLW